MLLLFLSTIVALAANGDEQATAADAPVLNYSGNGFSGRVPPHLPVCILFRALDKVEDCGYDLDCDKWASLPEAGEGLTGATRPGCAYARFWKVTPGFLDL